MNSSLSSFLKEVCSQFEIELNSKINILEIGSGSQSIFKENTQANITAIDKSVDAILASENTENIKFEVSSIQQFNSDYKFDIILDAHCLHCISEDSEREKALNNIFNLLADDGYFFVETMIQPSHDFVFFKNRLVKKAMEIEKEFIDHGFKIKYFFINPSLYFEDNDGYKNKCDVLRIVAQK